MIDQLDGRIGESWSGEVPNGSHINVVLARRGSPTAAAAAGALAGPRPGHLPFLACLSPGVLVRPATIVVNKSPIEGDGTLGPITWGAAQLGIAQGVLDAVADGLIDAAEVAEVDRARGRLGRPGRARRDSGQAREPRGDARRDRRRAAAAVGGGRRRRSSSAARTRRTSYYTGD